LSEANEKLLQKSKDQ